MTADDIAADQALARQVRERNARVHSLDVVTPRIVAQVKQTPLPKGAQDTGYGTVRLDVGSAIRRIRKAKGMTLAQVAEPAGTDTGNLSRIETNKQGFSQELINAIAQAMGITALAIFIEADPDTPSVLDPETTPAMRPFRNVPVVGTVEGGPDGYLEEFGHPVGHGDGSVMHPAKGHNAYALRVRGESMHPRIRSGEFIVVEPDTPYNPGDDVVVICHDGRKLVKQLLYVRDGEATLGSINNGFKPLTIQLADIQAIHYVAGILPRGAFLPG